MATDTLDLPLTARRILRYAADCQEFDLMNRNLIEQQDLERAAVISPYWQLKHNPRDGIAYPRKWRNDANALPADLNLFRICVAALPTAILSELRDKEPKSIREVSESQLSSGKINPQAIDRSKHTTAPEQVEEPSVGESLDQSALVRVDNVAMTIFQKALYWEHKFYNLLNSISNTARSRESFDRKYIIEQLSRSQDHIEYWQAAYNRLLDDKERLNRKLQEKADDLSITNLKCNKLAQDRNIFAKQVRKLNAKIDDLRTENERLTSKNKSMMDLIRSGDKKIEVQKKKIAAMEEELEKMKEEPEAKDSAAQATEQTPEKSIEDEEGSSDGGLEHLCETEIEDAKCKETSVASAACEEELRVEEDGYLMM